MNPFLRLAMRAASLSTMITSLPRSAKQAPLTKPTWPAPTTQMSMRDPSYTPVAGLLDTDLREGAVLRADLRLVVGLFHLDRDFRVRLERHGKEELLAELPIDAIDRKSVV